MNPHDHRFAPWTRGIRASSRTWRKPLAWDRDAARREAGHAADHRGGSRGEWRRPRVLVDADWLDPEVPAEWLADLLDLVAATPNLKWPPDLVREWPEVTR